MPFHPPCLRRLATIALVAPMLASCESVTEPEEQRLVDLLIDFCSNEVPVWVAYRNQDATWVRVTPDAEGTVAFTATNRVVFAFVRQQGADAELQVIYAHNFELEQISGRACLEETGTISVNGSATGHSGTSQVAQVTANFASVVLAQPQTTFTLTQLPSRPVDILASRVNLTATEFAASTLVIRRNQTFVNNATMPPIDLNILGGEAFAATSGTLTITGALSLSGFLVGTFFSQQETSHRLAYTNYVPPGSISIPMIPADKLAAGDYHDVAVVMLEGNGSRGAERFFHAPGPQTLAVAGGIDTPFISTIAATPHRRLRATADRASAYGGAFQVDYTQDDVLSDRRAIVTITRLYDGGTGQWRADIPDFSGVSGWQDSWGLQTAGAQIQWTATVTGGRAELLFGAPPEDGEGLPFATHSSSVSAASLHRSDAAATALLPRRSLRAR